MALLRSCSAAVCLLPLLLGALLAPTRVICFSLPPAPLALAVGGGVGGSARLMRHMHAPQRWQARHFRGAARLSLTRLWSVAGAGAGRNLVLVGQVLKPHGLSGDVKVKIHTDYPEARFSPAARIFIKQPHEDAVLPVKLAHCKLLYSTTFVREQAGEGPAATNSTTGGGRNAVVKAVRRANEALVRFEGFDATELQGSELYALASDRPPGSEDYIMASDMVGMFVVFCGCHPRDCVGIVERVLFPEDYCADESLADVLDPLLEIGRVKGGQWKTVTVPFDSSLIRKIDVDGRLLLLTVPQGLLDLDNG